MTTAGGLERAKRRRVAALGEVGREQEDAQAGPAQAELERLGVDRLGAERRARVEQEDALRAVMPAARAGARRGASPSPSGTRTRARPHRSGAPEAVSSAGRRTSSSVRSSGPDRKALLELAVGARLVEAVEGRQEAGGRGGPAAAALRDLDGGRDVVRLAQRVAQRLDLGELVLAMVALGAPRLRVAQAALPGAKRGGADAQHLGRGAGSNPRHRKFSAAFRRFRRSSLASAAVRDLAARLPRASATDLARGPGRPGRLLGRLEQLVGRWSPWSGHDGEATVIVTRGPRSGLRALDHVCDAHCRARQARALSAAARRRRAARRRSGTRARSPASWPSRTPATASTMR